LTSAYASSLGTPRSGDRLSAVWGPATVTKEDAPKGACAFWAPSRAVSLWP
jgi:hypothetical protein